jgi:hypothetical protein
MTRLQRGGGQDPRGHEHQVVEPGDLALVLLDQPAEAEADGAEEQQRHQHAGERGGVPEVAPDAHLALGVAGGGQVPGQSAGDVTHRACAR